MSYHRVTATKDFFFITQPKPKPDDRRVGRKYLFTIAIPIRDRVVLSSYNSACAGYQNYVWRSLAKLESFSDDN